jgi:hypothetical protein
MRKKMPEAIVLLQNTLFLEAQKSKKMKNRGSTDAEKNARSHCSPSKHTFWKLKFQKMKNHCGVHPSPTRMHQVYIFGKNVGEVYF